jgi:hypothetical protein
MSIINLLSQLLSLLSIIVNYLLLFDLELHPTLTSAGIIFNQELIQSDPTAADTNHHS